MWSIVYDKFDESWYVCEYSRSADGYLWFSDAEQACASKNAKLFKPNGGRESYDTCEANDVWPGGLAGFGVSQG